MPSHPESSAPVPSSDPASGFGQWVKALLFMLLGLAVSLHVLALGGFQALPGDVGDARFNNYLLEHTYGWISGAPLHQKLFSPPFYYPAPNVAAYSDLMLGFGPLYWPARALGLGPGHSYLVFIILSGLLSLAAGYYFLRRNFTFTLPAALAGAYLMALGQSHVGNLGHPQLFPFFYVILALSAIFSYFQALNREDASNLSRRKWLAVFFFCLTAQFYSAFYLCFFLSLGLLLALLPALASASCRPILKLALKRDYAALALCGLVALAAIYPLASQYAAVNRFYGKRNYVLEIMPLLPRPSSWINCGRSYLDRLILGADFGKNFTGPLEHLYGPGIAITLVSLSVFFLKRRDCRYRLLGLASLGLVLLSTIYNDTFSLWHLIWAYFPGASGIRAVGRLGLMLSIPCGLTLAWLVDAAPGKPALRCLCLILALLLLGEQLAWFETFDLAAKERDERAIAARIDPAWKAFLLTVRDPAQGYDFEQQIDAMFASSLAGIPTLNGYSGYAPADWPFNNPYTPSPAAKQKIETSLNAWCQKFNLDRTKIGVIELGGQ